MRIRRNNHPLRRSIQHVGAGLLRQRVALADSMVAGTISREMIMKSSSIQPFTRTLAQRGRAVAILCAVIAICAVVNLITWGLVRFTDLPVEHLTAQPETEPPLIVHSSNPQSEEIPIPDGKLTSDYTPGKPVTAGSDLRAGINNVITTHGEMLSAASSFARFVAFLSALMLMGQMLFAGLVASHSGLNGLPRMISAASAAILLALLLVPWSDLFPRLGFPGALPDFNFMMSTLPEKSSTTGISAFAAVGLNGIMPGIVLALTGLVALRYHVALDEEMTLPVDPDEVTSDFSAGAVTAAALARRDLKDTANQPVPGKTNRKPGTNAFDSLIKPARRAADKTGEKPLNTGPVPTQPPAPLPGDEGRRATQVGSTEPLRRPI